MLREMVKKLDGTSDKAKRQSSLIESIHVAV